MEQDKQTVKNKPSELHNEAARNLQEQMQPSPPSAWSFSFLPQEHWAAAAGATVSTTARAGLLPLARTPQPWVPTWLSASVGQTAQDCENF